MSVSVKYGRDRLSFAIPEQNTPLSAIRQSLSDYTGLPYAAFKLIHKGAVMRDDAAPISAYRITPNSVIQLIPIDQAHSLDQSSFPATTSADENALLTKIRTELAMVRSSLALDLNDLLLRNASPHQKTSEKDKMEFLRVGELLLQSLLRLDGLTPNREFELARAERKAAVKEVQGLLDTLDDTVAARRAAGLH